MGFGEEEAINALRLSGNKKNVAVSLFVKDPHFSRLFVRELSMTKECSESKRNILIKVSSIA